MSVQRFQWTKLTKEGIGQADDVVMHFDYALLVEQLKEATEALQEQAQMHHQENAALEAKAERLAAAIQTHKEGMQSKMTSETKLDAMDLDNALWEALAAYRNPSPSDGGDDGRGKP